MIISDDDDPEWHGYREAKRQRYEAVAESARSMLAAVGALRYEEACALCLDHAWQRDLQFCLTFAERVASQKPHRRRGRKAKMGALGVAQAALFAFEMATRRDATII